MSEPNDDDAEYSDATLRVDDVVDHEENCAACGVNERVDGTRHCEGCHDALVRADGGTQQTATQHTERRFLYLIVDAPDEEMVGKVESVDSPYATCEKNKLRPVNRRDLDTDETWTEQLVGLGYHDFEDYDDDERFAEVCQQKLADIDDEHIREARLEPEGVAPDA